MCQNLRRVLTVTVGHRRRSLRRVLTVLRRVPRAHGELVVSGSDLLAEMRLILQACSAEQPRPGTQPLQ